MNAKHILVFGAALVAASTSFAGDTNYQQYSAPASMKSRAEVIAELNAARANGEVVASDATYPVTSSGSDIGRSRQEVVAELQQYRAEHPVVVGDTNYPEESTQVQEQTRLAVMNMPATVQ